MKIGDRILQIHTGQTGYVITKPVKILNDIVAKDLRDINLDGAISELENPLLNLLENASQQIQIKILILFDTIFKRYPNALKNSSASACSTICPAYITDTLSA